MLVRHSFWLGLLALTSFACAQGADLKDAKVERLEPAATAAGKTKAKSSPKSAPAAGLPGDPLSMLSGGTCTKGSPCICTGSAACSKTCKGTGCHFICAARGACNFDCPAGQCRVTSSSTGATTLKCKGGGCSMTCTGATSCNLNECSSGCSTNCVGSKAVCNCSSGC